MCLRVFVVVVVVVFNRLSTLSHTFLVSVLIFFVRPDFEIFVSIIRSVSMVERKTCISEIIHFLFICFSNECFYIYASHNDQISAYDLVENTPVRINHVLFINILFCVSFIFVNHNFEVVVSMIRDQRYG